MSTQLAPTGKPYITSYDDIKDRAGDYIQASNGHYLVPEQTGRMHLDEMLVQLNTGKIVYWQGVCADGKAFFVSQDWIY